MASVEFKNIVKKYSDDKAVIKGFNLKIEDGEFTVLVGPSGCGKSTLLRIIAGLETVNSGEVYIDNRLVNDISPKDRDIAMVFQNYALYPHMNVFNNLAFGLKLRKIANREIDKQVKFVAGMLEIAELLGRKPKELSGGQRQRVALGRAIVRNPKVFLFDEPLSNLDAKLRVQMRTQIKKLHQDLKTTMIYVTHDQVEAMTMGDRIIILKDGEIQQIGTPIAVYQKPANMFVGSFIGSPAMNFIEGHIANQRFISDKLEVPVGNLECLAGDDCASVVLGVRPEDIQIGSGLIEAELIVAEPLGNETLLHLQIGKSTLIARKNSHDVYHPGSRFPVSLDMNKVAFFDSITQMRI